MRITELRYHAAQGLLRLVTDEGIEGWCAGVPAELEHPIVELFGDVVVGQSPVERERLWQAMVERAGQCGLQRALWAYVDVALWDLLGRALGQPVFRLIGGYRERLPAVRRGSVLNEAEAVLAEAAAAQREGFLGYIDRFAGSVSQVISLASRLRARLGPDIYLMHDAQRRYRPAEALRVGRALQAQDYYWLEAPLKGSDALGLRQLAAALDVPVLDNVVGGDSLRASAQLIATQAVDMLSAGVPASGGIADVLKLARLAGAFGNHCELEADDAMGGLVHAHLMGALNNVTFFQADQAGPQKQGPLRIEGGYVNLPTDPGIGWRVADPPMPADEGAR